MKYKILSKRYIEFNEKNKEILGLQGKEKTNEDDVNAEEITRTEQSNIDIFKMEIKDMNYLFDNRKK